MRMGNTKQLQVPFTAMLPGSDQLPGVHDKAVTAAGLTHLLGHPPIINHRVGPVGMPDIETGPHRRQLQMLSMALTQQKSTAFPRPRNSQALLKYREHSRTQRDSHWRQTHTLIMLLNWLMGEVHD